MSDILTTGGGLNGIYIGDENGVARRFDVKTWNSTIVTPYNMTSDTAPAPFRAKSKNAWTGYQAYKGFLYTNSETASADLECLPNNGGAPEDGEWWIEIDLGSQQYVDHGRMKTPGMDARRVWPRDFQILGSNDDTAWDDNITSDKWIVVGSIEDYFKPTSNYTWSNKFKLSNPDSYRYYRIRITKIYETFTDRGYVTKDK
jgi:hypothetical protein